jgi:hypothetical protein
MGMNIIDECNKDLTLFLKLNRLKDFGNEARLTRNTSLTF